MSKPIEAMPESKYRKAAGLQPGDTQTDEEFIRAYNRILAGGSVEFVHVERPPEMKTRNGEPVFLVATQDMAQALFGGEPGEVWAEAIVIHREPADEANDAEAWLGWQAIEETRGLPYTPSRELVAKLSATDNAKALKFRSRAR